MFSKIKKEIKDVLSIFSPIPYGFKKDERKLVRQYYIEKRDAIKIKHGIVVMIDGRYTHGGLTDRLRGIVNTFGLCKKYKKNFYLYHKFPFDIKDYLVPNEYDWSIDNKSISYNHDFSEPRLLFGWQLSVKYHDFYFRTFKDKKKQIHLYTNTRYNNQYFAQWYKELFKPSPLLQKCLDDATASLPTSYIAVVTRFQQLLGDFKEGNYRVLVESEREKLIEKCIEKIKDIHDSLYPEKQILCTSDSSTFLSKISQLPYVCIIPGKVVHVDYSEGVDKLVFAKSFVDLYMISEAEKVILLKTDDMYLSSFAMQAACIQNKPYEEIVF